MPLDFRSKSMNVYEEADMLASGVSLSFRKDCLGYRLLDWLVERVTKQGQGSDKRAKSRPYTFGCQ